MGCLGVSVEDIAYIDEIVTSEKHQILSNPKQIRIGIPKKNLFSDLAPSVEKASQRTLRKLKNAGFILIEDD